MNHSIVCLDGYTLNPGDVDWEPFEAMGRFTVYDRTPVDQIVARAAGHAAVLTNKVPMDENTMSQLPALRYIGVLATGYNIIDVQAARRRGIVVTNVPAYSTDSVAEHALALMLELSRRVGAHDAAVHGGEWARCEDWCFARAPICELSGRTLGLVGLGRIALRLARIADALDMRLIGHTPRWPDAQRLGGLVIESVELDALFSRADVVSLHCPLTQQTQRMVDRRRLALMKPTAFLINTGRGGLVDSDALSQSLREGLIAGAGMDVLEVEPPAANHPLLGAPNSIITPHVAWYAIETRRRLMRLASENLRAFFSGSAVNVVS